MGRLDQKIALITGGAKGQGKAEAKLFAAEGAKVILTDILDDEGKKVESEITELGGDAIYKHLDVSSEGESESVSRFIEERYGRLDILLNNAGVSVRNQGMDISVEDWDLMMEVNAKGVFLGTKSCVPIMQKSGGGSIINTGSIRALIGTAGADAYTSAKGGVVTLTRALALQWAHANIRVNAISPGLILTDRVRQLLSDDDPIRTKTPLGPSEPEEVAPLALYLASDESRQVTGAILPMDGGASVV